MAGSFGNSMRSRFEICSGDQRCLRHFSISARIRAFLRGFSDFGRRAERTARASARPARYESRSPFRSTCPEIAEGAQPRCSGVARCDCPVAKPITMASRSPREGKLSPTSPNPSASQTTIAAECALDAIRGTPETPSHFPMGLAPAKTPDDLVLVWLRWLARTSFSLLAALWVLDHYTKASQPPLETARATPN